MRTASFRLFERYFENNLALFSITKRPNGYKLRPTRKKAPLTTAVKSALNNVIRWKFR